MRDAVPQRPFMAEFAHSNLYFLLMANSKFRIPGKFIAQTVAIFLCYNVGKENLVTPINKKLRPFQIIFVKIALFWTILYHR